MAIVDKSKLLSRRVAEDTVEIDGVGEVAVRAVTRYELLTAGKGVNEEKVPDLIERRMLVAGIVDPPLTMAEAEEWQKGASAGEVGKVLQRIRELSALTEGAAKSGV
ncbi:hypothetical protein ACH4T9_19965 [Micromonospora sp. NPDC020750]|uniref:hypothetical protein n=1 Tax=unclassified Micromonospora TaxID=2617518 RepID=UPI003792416F